MNKLLWVSLPLIAFSLWLGWRALRQQLPPRLALNVLTSLLLLIYLGITAALGIFWVANQHLPVFDWHYLFGYATIALLLIHLGFNAPLVWRWLTQPKLKSGPRPHLSGRNPAATSAAGRRSFTLGIAVALGSIGAIGYWLGLRHGKTQLIVGGGSRAPAAKPQVPTAPNAGYAYAAPDSAASSDQAAAVVKQFHEFSAHSRGGLFRRAPSVHWGGQPLTFKAVPRDSVWLSLPRARSQAAVAIDAISGTPQQQLQALADVLWHVAGISLNSGGIAFRTAPSSGALFATELYLCAPGWPELSQHWWRYDAQAHRLVAHTRLSDPAPWVSAPEGRLRELCIVATAVFMRSGHKYRDRTYRYVLADLGHALENLDLAARARGWPLDWSRGFDDAGLARLLSLDEAQEGVLAVATLGRLRAAGPATPKSLVPARLTSALGPLGVTNAVHLATSLRVNQAATRSEVSGQHIPRAIPADSALPRHAQTARACALMASRRSRRRFSDRPLPEAELRSLLQATQYPGAANASSAVRAYVLAHAVEGLSPTSWRWQGHEAHPGSPWRQVANAMLTRSTSLRAGLDQDVIGDAAAVVIFVIFVPLLHEDPYGFARGYRHALLEVGHRGERLYLEAQARGIGCCGVGAFYDDDASALIGVDPDQHWVAHFVALGWPV